LPREQQQGKGNSSASASSGSMEESVRLGCLSPPESASWLPDPALVAKALSHIACGLPLPRQHEDEAAEGGRLLPPDTQVSVVAAEAAGFLVPADAC